MMIRLGLFGADDNHRRLIERTLSPEITVVFSERPTKDYAELLGKGVEAVLIDVQTDGADMDDATLDVMTIMQVPTLTNDERIEGATALKKRMWKNHMLGAIGKALDITIDRKDANYQVVTTPSGDALNIWVLAASAGGPPALQEFLLELPPKVPAAFILVQHNDEAFLEMYLEMIAQYATNLKPAIAKNGQRVQQGDLLIVPPKYALDIGQDGLVKLVSYKREPRFKPSADIITRLIGERFGPRSGVVVFSGMGDDGALGAKELKKHGGAVYAQQPETAVQPSMPSAVIATGVADDVAPPATLARHVGLAQVR